MDRVILQLRIKISRLEILLWKSHSNPAFKSHQRSSYQAFASSSSIARSNFGFFSGHFPSQIQFRNSSMASDSLKNGAKKGDHNEDMSASRRSMIATEVELQENPNIIFGDSSVDVSSQRSVNLMENQGFLSNGSVMVPRLSLNQLQNSSQQSWTGGPTQLWRDCYDVNNPSFATNQYWNGGSISGRVNMIDFMVNSSQTKSHHPT